MRHDDYRRICGYQTGTYSSRMLNVRSSYGYGGSASGIAAPARDAITSQLGITDKPKVKNNLKLLLL